MVTLTQLRATAPSQLAVAATELMSLNRTFTTALDGAHNDVSAAMAHWQGDGAAAASARSAADHVTGSHLGTAVDAQVDALNEAAASLGPARQTVLAIADDASHSGCTPAEDGRVRAPQFGSQPLLQMVADEKARAFEARLVAALNTFDELDAHAAAALTAATNAVEDLARKPEGAPPSSRVADLIYGKQPIPTDPKAFHDLWITLTPAEKDALWQHDQYLGNHDGMPAVDRDHYNEVKLTDETTRAASAQAQLDQLTQQHTDWARGDNIPHNDPGARFKDVDDYNLWKRNYDDAKNRAKSLPDLRAVEQTLQDHPESMLMLLDTQSGAMAHAAVAVGNPDTAQHVSVTAGGLNTTVGDSLPGMANEAQDLKRTANAQLTASGRSGETVATIAWIGADLPQVDKGGNLDKLAGAVQVAGDGLAKAGAPSLSHFLRWAWCCARRSKATDHRGGAFLRVVDDRPGVAATWTSSRHRSRGLWLAGPRYRLCALGECAGQVASRTPSRLRDDPPWRPGRQPQRVRSQPWLHPRVHRHGHRRDDHSRRCAPRGGDRPRRVRAHRRQRESPYVRLQHSSGRSRAAGQGGARQPGVADGRR